MKTPNQIHVRRDDVRVTAEDLLQFPKGDITLVHWKTVFNAFGLRHA
jgi:hypothetical protein